MLDKFGKKGDRKAEGRSIAPFSLVDFVDEVKAMGILRRKSFFYLNKLS